jgi:hypothetical protein
VGGSIGLYSAMRTGDEYAPAVKVMSYPSTFGFWSWSKKDFCRVDMEMVGSAVSQMDGTRRRVVGGQSR